MTRENELARAENARGSASEAPSDAQHTLDEFTKCLNAMSFSRAGWDYQLPPKQRAEEDRQEAQALHRARAIWAENPNLHDDLRAAFRTNSPLATMQEIEQAAIAKAGG